MILSSDSILKFDLKQQNLKNEKIYNGKFSNEEKVEKRFIIVLSMLDCALCMDHMNHKCCNLSARNADEIILRYYPVTLCP